MQRGQTPGSRRRAIEACISRLTKGRPSVLSGGGRGGAFRTRSGLVSTEAPVPRQLPCDVGTQLSNTFALVFLCRFDEIRDQPAPGIGEVGQELKEIGRLDRPELTVGG